MKKLAAVLVLLGAVPTARPAAAQEERSTPALVAEIQERLRALQAEANARRTLVGREIRVLQLLADAADSVTPFATGFGLDRARKKVDEADALLDIEPALPEPVPGTVERVGLILQRPAIGAPPPQVRAELFGALAPLQEHLLSQAEQLQGLAAVLSGLEASLSQAQSPLRSAITTALHANIAVQRLSLK